MGLREGPKREDSLLKRCISGNVKFCMCKCKVGPAGTEEVLIRFNNQTAKLRLVGEYQVIG